ncbi:MAG: hypothetical protein Q7Q73_19175 [Verrucomicrobiota bacterium JB024]|nr:hypothetical protein [Verrucomicrobiota bacterium JB024]
MPTAVPARETPLTVGPVLDVWGVTDAAQEEDAQVPEAPSVQVRITQNNYFQIAGEDYISVQYVTHMAQQAGEYGSSLVPMPNSLPLPILVELIPPDKAGFDSPFLIRPQPNGDVHVRILWGEDTEFAQVCQALMSGYLVRCAIWRFGTEASAEVPDWFELGAGLGLELELRPALIDEVVLRSREDNPWPLTRLFALKGSESDPEARRQCLWLLRFLQNQSPERDHFRRLMAGFLKNLPPFHLLASAFPDQFTNQKDAELWWAVGYEMAIRARSAPFYSLDESIRLIRDSASITAELNNGDVRARIHELFPYRGNPLMQKAALQRLREIKLELQKVNPVYYNSLLTLGTVYEAWMALPLPDVDYDPNAELTEAERAYFQSIELFRSDYQAAQLLDLEIKRLLNW